MLVLFQRCHDVSCDVYVCCINYSKAVDNVKYDKLMLILQSIGLDNKDIRIIHHLYYNQTANIKVRNELTEEVTTQRHIISSLFNLYSKEMMKKALKDRN